jgi:nucleoside-diphosphate-sugar epimerase
MPPKALVTGATGFIGGHLTEELVKRRWEVECWCRPQSRTTRLDRLPVRVWRGDLDDHDLLRRAVSAQEYVFHLAARIHSAPRKVYERVNHVFTRNLVRACMEAAAPLRRLVYVSSIAAAGPSRPGHLKTEAAPCRPRTEYGRSKLRGEEEARQAGANLPFTIIRPPNVYGPRQRETDLLIRMIQKRIVPVLRQRKPCTSLIYVKDLSRGMIKAALSPVAAGQTYYLTDGKIYSWRRVLFTLKDILLGPSLYLPIPEALIAWAAGAFDGLKHARLLHSYFGRRAWESMTQTSWLFSSSKARIEWGFTPRYSLEQGLLDTLGHFPHSH